MRHVGDNPVLESVGGRAPDVGGQVGRRGEPPAEPAHLAVADELVARNAEGAQAGGVVERAAPEGGDVVVFDGAEGKNIHKWKIKA